ncbi:UBP-type zinc finger domain-containing protein [Rhodococcus oxybenzonivorans]
MWHVGCCDASPSQHASAHFRGTGHPVAQSFEPGEDWFLRRPHRGLRQRSVARASARPPEDQPVPGPAGRVPSELAGTDPLTASSGEMGAVARVGCR